ncbi:MAG: hypothetical protein JO053_08400 [Acidobacteria bacterium]|nr:hypothetical protein [Acidobacteriota bacterium]
MTTKSPNLISIGINRQRVGIAVFANGELEYVTGRPLPAVTSNSGRWRLMTEILQLAHHHQLGIVAMQRLTVQQRHSRAVSRVYKGIQTRAIRSGLTVVIESSFGTKKNEATSAETLASIYPELRRYLGGTAWQRRYYKHIFRAVSAGGAWLRATNDERVSDEP